MHFYELARWSKDDSGVGAEKTNSWEKGMVGEP